MARTLTIIGLALVVGLGFGCGDEEDEGPPSVARGAVVSLVAALKAGDGAAACRLVDEGLRPDLRVAALGGFRPVGATQAERLAQVKAAQASARTCPGAMRLLARDLGPRSDRLLAQARTLPMTWLAPQRRGIVTLGGEQWAVEKRENVWTITIANAIVDALP